MATVILLYYIAFFGVTFGCRHPDDEVYLCSSLNTLHTASLSGSISFQLDIEQSSVYSYSHVTTTTASNVANFGNYFVCYLVSDSETQHSCYEIYQNGVSSNRSLCMYHLGKIAPPLESQQVLNVPHPHFVGDYAQFTVYTANQLCITIKSASITTSTQSYVTGHVYGMDVNGASQQSIAFLTHLSPSTATTNPTWNQVICLPNNAANNISQIGANLAIVGIDGSSTSTQTQIISRTDGTDQSFDIDFGNGYILSMEYWESCTVQSKRSQMKDIENRISSFNFYFLLILLIVGGIALLTAAIASNLFFKYGDPVNYYAVIWMILEMWDFESDVGFAAYLWFFYTIYAADLSFPPIILFLLCSAATFFVVIPYLSNLSYLYNLIQMWSQPATAAGASKQWLVQQRGRYTLLVVCLLTGGVHPALELCNSLLLPISLFAMHLPYGEHVRIRTERFLTNVALENFPFLLIQIVFYILLNQHEDSANHVFWGTVVSSVLSVIFSATYFFSFRHQKIPPIANYAFSFELQSDQLKPTWIHSHWKIQIAVSKAFQRQSPMLVIIDECVNSSSASSSFASKRMRVKGRILKDRTASTDVFRSENASETTESLFNLLCQTFDLDTGQAKIHEVQTEQINDQRVFDLEKANTMKWICCWCCCRANENFKVRERWSTFEWFNKSKK